MRPLLAPRWTCLVELRMLADVVRSAASPLGLIGVGGVSSAAGAHHVQIATAAMLDPGIGLRIRRDVSNLAA